MKTHHLIALLAGTLLAARAADPESPLIVHEWGTFTSVQGGDGVLLPWYSPQVGELPEFVHDWSKPGANRATPLALSFGKGGLRATQRMETPVIYFYSDAGFATDVTVRFPQGVITEWFPQANEIGGARGTNGLRDGVIRWLDVRVLPPDSTRASARRLPASDRGNHYFAARETDSAVLRTASQSQAHPVDEYEKFLFYRGAGDFAAPLKVTVGSDGVLSVANSGDEPLRHLFLLDVHDGAGRWAYLEALPPGQSHSWKQLDSFANSLAAPMELFATQIGEAKTSALEREGLFKREAAAMVATWRKSWFTEEGVRVLYVLPRRWTEAILPLEIQPAPTELVRVMVGRAEVITPATQRKLATLIPQSNQGDATAQAQLQETARRLGRFYNPAYQLGNLAAKQSTD